MVTHLKDNREDSFSEGHWLVSLTLSFLRGIGSQGVSPVKVSRLDFEEFRFRCFGAIFSTTNVSVLSSGRWRVTDFPLWWDQTCKGTPSLCQRHSRTVST